MANSLPSTNPSEKTMSKILTIELFASCVEILLRTLFVKIVYIDWNDMAVCRQNLDR